MPDEDDPKHLLGDVIGPTDQLERVLVEKIEAAEEFVRRARALLEQIHGDGSSPDSARLATNPHRYAGIDPYNATVFLLRKRDRALTEKEIVTDLLAGNVMTGSKKQTAKDKAENIKRSLKANINNGKLKLINDRFGFPDWPDDMFNA
jgi:hypothetical protein